MIPASKTVAGEITHASSSSAEETINTVEESVINYGEKQEQKDRPPRRHVIDPNVAKKRAELFLKLREQRRGVSSSAQTRGAVADVPVIHINPVVEQANSSSGAMFSGRPRSLSDASSASYSVADKRELFQATTERNRRCKEAKIRNALLLEQMRRSEGEQEVLLPQSAPGSRAISPHPERAADEKTTSSEQRRRVWFADDAQWRTISEDGAVVTTSEKVVDGKGTMRNSLV